MADKPACHYEFLDLTDIVAGRVIRIPTGEFYESRSNRRLFYAGQAGGTSFIVRGGRLHQAYNWVRKGARFEGKGAGWLHDD